MFRNFCLSCLLVIGSTLLLPLSLIAQDQGANRKGIDFFEAKIRPMLVTHCYECHSAGAAAKNKLKAGLFLDSREGMQMGGESGPAVVPGKPEESLLISALRHEDLEMPPKGKLEEELIGHFVKWVEMGAPDPREGGEVVTSPKINIEAGRSHWAFQPLTSPLPPDVGGDGWAQTPIDQFILHRLTTAGITPNPLAEPQVLIRRTYFDLIGLPPTPEQLSRHLVRFELDSKAAYEELIDELLASEHYGERWGRHWLDVVRFAESNGYAFDGDRPNAWHYRDFVIKALNSDMPYNEFIRQQIAGDLLADVNAPTSGAAQVSLNTLAATGYLVAGPYTTQQTQKERERSRYEQLDDIVNTLGTSLLGLTMGCSRCHDHKFDPLPMYDYYNLAACFADVGFSDTGINMQPEQFRELKAAYDAAHAPLVAAQTKYEQETLPGQFEQWLTTLTPTVVAPTAKLTLSEWHHAGPFAGENFEQAFANEFDPEKGVDLAATYVLGDSTIKWTPQPEWKDDTVHNTFNGDNAANYIFRVIESEEDQAISLSLGSDDAIKVWVNGQEAIAKLVGRAAAAGQESVQVPIRKGRNELLMKVVNGGGPSGFYFAATPVQLQKVEGIGSWWHVGPFPAANFDLAFSEVFAPEKGIDTAAAYDDGKLKWTEQPDWKDGEAHNDKLTGTNAANYLFRRIESPTPQVLSLSLGSDDGIKLWVNGREVLSKKVGRNVAAAGQETAVVQLAAGTNDILMKIVNGGGATGFYFAASPASEPKEVADIINVAADQRNDDQKRKLVDWYKGFDPGWLALNAVVARHATEDPQPNLTNVFSARVNGTTYQFGEDTYKVYHLRRGNADNKEQEAAPGVLRVLLTAQEVKLSDDTEPTPAPGLLKSEAGTPSRLALADWLTDSEDGAGALLARVMVNRLWYHHFGRGIVATPSDFGTRGEPPTHPELLDWLATELIRNDWQLKPIHKLIMMSSVYRQGTAVVESGAKIDPENMLLWRRSARRLEAEVIRDSLLAVTGELDTTLYGKGTLDLQSKRRSLYFTVKRSNLIPILKLFDAPDAMQGIGSREESTVAPQALALLNSPLVRDLAGKFAAKVRPTPDVTLEQAIGDAYLAAFGRVATGPEIATMQAFVEQQKASRGGDANAESLAVRDFCHLLLCMNEFVYVD
ncbi:MAG: PSD1 domain-containing protein [Planctomycetaceae bacterium]|nr:PSD1 domain-containing protein [Planctomycetaceae bacterium]